MQDDPKSTGNGGGGVLKSAPGTEAAHKNAAKDKNLLSANDSEVPRGNDQRSVPGELENSSQKPAVA